MSDREVADAIRQLARAQEELADAKLAEVAVMALSKSHAQVSAARVIEYAQQLAEGLERT